MNRFFASGQAFDLVLAILAIEFGALVWRAKGAERRAAAINWALALTPGALILLAARAAATGAGWAWIAAFLAASFPVHIADLMRRRR